MARNYRWLNRTRLNVHLLESRVQPGSWFTTGVEAAHAASPQAHAALGAGLLTPPHDRPQVSFTQQETFGQSPRHGQETVPQQITPAAAHAESTSDTVVPDSFFEPALFQAPLADPLAPGTRPRSRLVRQRIDSGVMTSHGGSPDVVAPPASVSAHSHAISRAAVVHLRTAAPLAVPLGLGTNADSTESDTHKQTIAENYGRLPLRFEQNVGQFDDRVNFVARTDGMTTFLTPTAAVFAVQNSESRIQNSESADWRAGRVNALDASLQGVDTPRSPGVAVYMEIVGANPAGRAAGVNPLEGKINYFIGNDPSQWHTNIATFGAVTYQDVYPGIDLVYYGNNGALEYDFIVSPGTDPNVIALDFAGADGVEIDPQGNLLLHTAAGDVMQQKPLTYQQHGDSRQEIASRYVLNGTSVRFEVGAYDPTQPLVIDPLVLGYSTYLGGSGGDDGGNAIAVDAAGNAYVTAWTISARFPTTPGAFDTSLNGDYDAFVAKLNADGASLAYGTFLGGTGVDFGLGIAVDAAGNAYVTGSTDSTNFPTTPGAFDTSYDANDDGFVARLSADGASLHYGTYLGGSSEDHGDAIAVDTSGNAYVTGSTVSTDFPTTPRSFDTDYNGGSVDAFVAKLSADGASLVYGTYFGASTFDRGVDIAVDASGNAYVSVWTNSTNFPTTPGAFDTSHNGSTDAFMAKLSADGTSLVYGTYLGGTDEDGSRGIAVDAASNAYVTGYTRSTDFPTTPGAFDTSHNGSTDVFVAKVSADGASVDYSTYLGGVDHEYGHGIALDAVGNAYVTGWTSSTNFPTTPGAFDTSHNGSNDAFIAKVSADGASLTYGTYLGGSDLDRGHRIAVDAAGSAYVTGYTDSTNFPTTPGVLKRRNRGSSDGFVTKFAEVLRTEIRPMPAPAVTAAGPGKVGIGTGTDVRPSAHMAGHELTARCRRGRRLQSVGRPGRRLEPIQVDPQVRIHVAAVHQFHKHHHERRLLGPVLAVTNHHGVGVGNGDAVLVRVVGIANVGILRHQKHVRVADDAAIMAFSSIQFT